MAARTEAPLRVVLMKPSKYWTKGVVERYRRGFMPNSTLRHIQALTPPMAGGRPVQVTLVDEYVHGDLDYLERLRPESCDLLALVGVQSHQFHRALDLAALARARGVPHVVLGGPHPITCDTEPFHGRGVSFALAEAEVIWPAILADAAAGALQPLYGRGPRWQAELPPAVLTPPTRREMARYAIPMFGLYPARGCPFNCTFCSVIQIAGHRVRGQPVTATLASLRAARAAGVRFVMFTSDNFNKYPEARELLAGMIAEKIDLPFFAQCDVQVGQDEAFIELLARAGCFQLFVGIESFSRETLTRVRKTHNRPEDYERLAALCRKHRVGTHFSSIIGFPTETEADIRGQLARLRAIQPTMASFYILTPIPGTVQYEEFRAARLITEPNLDRFDGINAVWRHPHLSAAALERLVFASYRGFYGWGDIAGKALFRRDWGPRDAGRLLTLYSGLFTRMSVAAGHHPMAGGVGRVTQDRAADYAELRRRTFGIDLAPLPARRDVDPAELAANRAIREPEDHREAG